MIDIELIRSNPDAMRANLEKRNDAEKLSWLEELIEKDKLWRQLKQEEDLLRNKRNILTDRIKDAKKANQDISALLAEAQGIPKKIDGLEKQVNEARQRCNWILTRLPNILHESVPVGKDDTENVSVKTWGRPKKQNFEVKHHGQIATELGIADFENAVKISGTGFFFLKGGLALLDIALQRFAIDWLVKQGFVLVQPPFLMSRRPYEGVAPLDDFESVMYKIEGQDLYLIATSEHPLTAMHMNTIFSEESLPIKMAGVSACFRREIGKHGLDERGFFRVHQFNKIEQIILCLPDDSYKWHEVLRKNAEAMLTELGVPWRTVNVCTGDMGIVASKKYDIEGWSPRENKFIELMSCSNCTDFQSAGLNMKYRLKGGEKKFIHTLNSTMVATTRALRIILENYQTAKGTVLVPKALQKYMNGIKEISLPKISAGKAEKKLAAKAKPKKQIKSKKKKSR